MGRSKDLATGETRFVNVTGDTMTGALTGTSAGFTGDVNIGNNDASNPVSKLRLGATLYGAADIVPVSTGHKIGLDFKTDSTGDTTIDPVTRMSISNEGYITKPFQPAFYARGIGNTASAGGTANGGEYLLLGSTSVPVNNGSHYIASNGTFTVPVAGLYYFSLSLLYDNSFNTTGAASIRKNGSDVGEYGYVEGGNTGYLQVSASAVVSCAANDAIRVYSSIAGWHIAGESSWTGFLIG